MKNFQPTGICISCKLENIIDPVSLESKTENRILGVLRYSFNDDGSSTHQRNIKSIQYIMPEQVMDD